ncbi:hypothetical protein EPO34_04820 [Patescibacteria group bacterium]|nr:MAG: hypothetical protein EPO34_04820 [Patescibacteria group bacterium]
MPHHVYVRPIPARTRRIIAACVVLVSAAIAVGWVATVGRSLQEGFAAAQEGLVQASRAAQEIADKTAADREAMRQAFKPAPAPEPATTEPPPEDALLQKAAQAMKDSLALPAEAASAPTHDSPATTTP